MQFIFVSQSLKSCQLKASGLQLVALNLMLNENKWPSVPFRKRDLCPVSIQTTAAYFSGQNNSCVPVFSCVCIFFFVVLLFFVCCYSYLCFIFLFFVPFNFLRALWVVVMVCPSGPPCLKHIFSSALLFVLFLTDKFSCCSKTFR